MIDFLINPEWKKNQSLAPGDIAVLKFQDSFLYSVKCIVTNVASNNIKGHVEAVFDADARGEILQHEMKSQERSFMAKNVFDITKKKAP